MTGIDPPKVIASACEEPARVMGLAPLLVCKTRIAVS